MTDALVTHGERARDTGVVVIGGGIAGISLALRLPTDVAVTLVTKEALGESNTRYAQGGLAAAVGAHDSPASHESDTLAAGAGHCDPDAVRALVAGAGEAVAWLVAAGAEFDPAQPGAGPDDAALVGGARLALGHEAAHSHHRVLHARGDATGAEIERALVAALRRRPNTVIIEHGFATDVIMRDDTIDDVCAGVRVMTGDGGTLRISARAVVLANGGAGRLWRRTSNPTGATADGLALAWRAGAALTDLEFAQFHPTVLVPPDPDAPAFLISEAVRGEGAYLRNHAGARFMASRERAELEPRDVVARAILTEMLREGTACEWLDLRHLDADHARRRFPTIAATCAEYGLDLARDLIPVAPAAHYFMGGVAVDLDARTTVPGLWAIGEVACTGVHGANRLASNSLLEGLVFGRRAAQAITADLADPTALDRWPVLPRMTGTPSPPATVWDLVGAPATAQAGIQAIMWERVGLYRDGAGLMSAAHDLRRLAATLDEWPASGRAERETANMLTVAQLVAIAALLRDESRGAHARVDFPDAQPRYAGDRHFIIKPGVPFGYRRAYVAGQSARGQAR